MKILYEEPERPQNVMEHIERDIGASENVDVDGLERENEQLRRQLALATWVSLSTHRPLPIKTIGRGYCQNGEHKINNNNNNN